MRPNAVVSPALSPAMSSASLRGSSLGGKGKTYTPSPGTPGEGWGSARCGTAAPSCDCASPPEDHVAQPPPAVSSFPGTQDTAEGGCATSKRIQSLLGS